MRIGKPLVKTLLRPQEHRIQKFRNIFGDVVGDCEKLIITFSCAFQNEVLVQGRMYISENYLSFYSNILCWETQITIPFSKVVRITKEKTARLFPNGILVETLESESFFFTSLSQRDKSFAQITEVWRSVIGKKKAMLREVSTPKIVPKQLTITSQSSKNVVKPVTRQQQSAAAMGSPRPGKSSHINDSASTTEKNVLCKVPFGLPDSEFSAAFDDIAEDSDDASDAENDAKLTCRCTTHIGKVLINDVFPLTTEEIFEILFSKTPWYQQFEDIVKTTAQARLFESISGYAASPWIKDAEGTTSRTVTYTMALNHAMAPKSTVVTEEQTCSNLDETKDGFIVRKESRNAGIPYADSFVIQITYCVTRISSNRSRLLVHGGVIYKKNIWGIVKGYIEKSACAGIEDHYATLQETLRVHCARIRASRNASPSLQRSPNPQLKAVSVHKKHDHSAGSSDGSSSRYKPSDLPNSPEYLLDPSIHVREAQTQTLIISNAEMARYAQLIIALLATLILLHVLILLRLPSESPSLRCSTSSPLPDLNDDPAVVASLMRLQQNEKEQSAVLELRETIDRVETKLSEVRQLWRTSAEK